MGAITDGITYEHLDAPHLPTYQPTPISSLLWQTSHRISPWEVSGGTDLIQRILAFYKNTNLSSDLI